MHCIYVVPLAIWLGLYMINYYALNVELELTLNDDIETVVYGDRVAEGWRYPFFSR